MTEPTTEQTRFLILHARTTDYPVKWKWHFRETMLRAYTDRGNTATITKGGFAALVDGGLMVPLGCAGARITDAGLDAIGQLQGEAAE